MQDDESEWDDNPTEDLAESLRELGLMLAQAAQEQVNIRQQLEERWLDDLEQYMGRYDAKTLENLEARITAGEQASKAFFNITRPKVDTAEALIGDMLFPSDDSNWAIQATPIPEIADFQPETLKQLQQEAKKRADLMTAEIEDQLIETDYHRKAREAIHDACLFGTGVLKAVVVTEKTTKKWQKIHGATHAVEKNQQLVPGVEKVDLWNFFPDMSARISEDCEFFYERRYVSRSQLKKLAKRRGYIKENIEKILRESQGMETNATVGTHVSRLMELSGMNTDITKNRFELWEYHGELQPKQLIACGCEIEDDSLSEISATVVFINGIVIKGDIKIDDCEEPLYSILTYKKDDSSIFGFGIAYLLRDEQRCVNSALRMTYDNAALTTKPQIIFDRESVIPANGNYRISSGGVWYLINGDIKSVRDVFATHDIASHQAELLNLIELAKKMADDSTNLPLIVQGSQEGSPDTARGTAILMNAANVTLRRIVRHFDDYVTSPIVTRFYNWNMQFNDKEEIKGDMTIDARGSSVLLVKEQQNASLQQLLITAQQPLYAPLIKQVELLRKAVQAERLNADDIIKTDAEIKADAQQPPDPMQQQIQQLTFEKLKAEIEQIAANIEQLKSKITVSNVDSLCRSIQAAIELAKLNPNIEINQLLATISKMADEIYQSAGGQDYNKPPIFQPPPTQENQNGAIQTSTTPEVLNAGQVGMHNTHPQYPANPDVGMMQGIDS